MVFRRRLLVLLSVTVALSACASTPESRLRNDVLDVYWLTAHGCKSRFTNFGVQNVGMDGRVQLQGHTSAGIDEFRRCYWDGMAAQIERRRAAGRPVPEGWNPHPEVEIDLD